MTLLAGVFATQTQADEALLALKVAGFEDDRLALVAPHPRPEATEASAAAAASAEQATNAAALGAAVGLILGGGLLGPVGTVLGGLAGGGLGGLLAARGMPEADAARYDMQILGGRYVLTVDARSPSEEEAARHVLAQVGVQRVVTEPPELREHPDRYQEVRTSAAAAGLLSDEEAADLVGATKPPSRGPVPPPTSPEP